MSTGADPGAGAAPSLGGYRLLRLLGRGGVGEVYEALSADGQHVALKTFRVPEDELGLAADAFEREAELGRRLVHPGIVRLLGGGRNGEHVYLAMEYVDGHDLRRHTARSALLPLPRVLGIAGQVARALAAAHVLGVVHRDITPGNVLIEDGSGAVKVTDFGLARIGDAFHSRTGIVAGTPSYMAPEQLAEGTIGPGTDLYALGVLVFELLTGRLPFEATSLGQLLRLVGRQAPPRVDSLRPDIPAGVASLLAELLEPQLSRRPADAGAVADRLDRHASALSQPGRDG